jgi:lysophospholipase L1-like esterase
MSIVNSTSDRVIRRLAPKRSETRHVAGHESPGARPHRARNRTTLLRVGMTIAAVLFTLFALDKGIWLYVSLAPPSPILIFPPSSQATFQTPEYEFTAATSSIGIRDNEIALADPARWRVLALGDSFTYGWGVELEETWAKVAERRLPERSPEAEVLNLGCPGLSVDGYAKIAQRAIPILKPKVVLVAVLQGDDLSQLALGTTAPLLDGPDEFLSRFPGARAVPNLAWLLARFHAYRTRVVSADDIRAEWQRQMGEICTGLTKAGEDRFARLDSEVRQRLTAGQHNPWLAGIALRNHEYLAFTLDLERPAARRAISSMARSLAAIRQEAEREQAKMLVVSVPAFFTSAQTLAGMRRIGFRLDDAAVASDAPDAAIREACLAAGVPFHSVTKVFREAAAHRDLYYDLDGHFNRAGHELFGEEIAKLLRNARALKRDRSNYSVFAVENVGEHAAWSNSCGSWHPHTTSCVVHLVNN